MSVALLGFPWDSSSSYSKGPALAPNIIQAVLSSASSSPYSISGRSIDDVVVRNSIETLPADGEAARSKITEIIVAALQNNEAPLSLGGDHSITFPILAGFESVVGPVNVLHIDAHPDLYDEFNGDRYSHASPFARAIEAGCIGTLVQVGLRSVSPEQRQFGEKCGVVMLGADALDAIPFDRLTAPLYVSIDVDGLDPAFAPGVSHPEPGGLTTREVLKVLSHLRSPPLGADIVEYNPERDQGLTTAHVCARLVKELAALMST